MVTIICYVLNLLAVRALGLAWRWEAAAVLTVVERAGRAIRSPTRDAMLSHAASHTELGWGFGLHQAMDQTGAIIGPLPVSAALSLHYNYAEALSALIVLALVSITAVFVARSFQRVSTGFPRRPRLSRCRMVLCGLGMSMQEPLMRAVVASMTTPNRRATAFGILNAIFGPAWFADSSLLDIIYDRSVVAVAVTSLVPQLLAVPVLLVVMRKGWGVDDQDGDEIVVRGRYFPFVSASDRHAAEHSRLGAPVLQDLNLFDGDQTARHHFVKQRQKGINLVLAIHDLHDHRKVLRQAQNLGRVNVTRMPKADVPTKNRRTRQMYFARLQHDCLVERQMTEPIGLAKKDAEQYGVTREFHSYIHFVELTTPASA
jgi:hypothetical protein